MEDRGRGDGEYGARVVEVEHNGGGGGGRLGDGGQWRCRQEQRDEGRGGDMQTHATYQEQTRQTILITL